MYQTSKRLLYCLTLLLPVFSFAEIRLPAILSNDMVLQRESTVNFWGWCNPGEKVFITTSWNNHTDSVKGTGYATWTIPIQTPAAGGPYSITIKGSNTIELNNILIGEVWVCSGQSNMEWSSLNGLPEMDEEIPSSQNNQIRLFHVPKTTSLFPQDNIGGSWKVSGPESVHNFSAVAYWFGKKLQKELGVPVGLINSSWGGTPAEVWTPEIHIAANPVLQQSAQGLKDTDWWPAKPGALYNAMIAPISSFNIAGAIWYQGESNTFNAPIYDKLLTTMVDSWRAAWKKQFPFYYVQIAPFNYGNHNVGALVREAQQRASSHPKTGMIVVSDLVEDVKDIHPRQKKGVGDRLALWALGDHYGVKGISYKSPEFKEMNIDKNKVTITLNNAEDGLMLKNGNKATEFLIAGADKVFVPAEVKIAGNKLVLTSKMVKEPEAVRYSFSNAGIGNVFNKSGLPLAPFRTDNWEVDTSKL